MNPAATEREFSAYHTYLHTLDRELRVRRVRLDLRTHSAQELLATQPGRV